MNEAEWLSCSEPQAMLEWLTGRAGDRKWRLFACAAARAVWASLAPHRVRRAVEVGERFADGEATEQGLRRAHSQGCGSAHAAVWQGSRRQPDHPSVGSESRLFFAAHAAHPCSPFPLRGLLLVQTDDGLKAISPLLLRDLFGPLPFRSVAIDPAWLGWNSGTVGRLAMAAYEGRQMPAGTLEPERLAVLGDALQEAGCEDPDILGHLRDQQQVHVRGCFVLDLLLGKS
jgi:hypothetical protein